MKIIENKKLFGKINIVDILLVVIILAGGLIAYNKVFKNDSNVAIGAKYYTTTLKMRVESVSPELMKFLETGVDVYDNETNQFIGKLVGFESGDCYMNATDYSGDRYVSSLVPEKINIYLIVEIQVAERAGDLINSSNYFSKVGKYINVRAGKFAGGGYIIEIKDIPELAKEKVEKKDGTFNYKIYVEDLSATSKPAFHVGDEVYDKMSNAYLGRIVEFEFRPFRKQLQGFDGTTTLSEVPNKIAVMITVNTEGELKNGEYLANGLTRIQGGSFKTIKTDYIMCSGMIMDIED